MRHTEQQDSIHDSNKDKKLFSSNPNVSSLTSNELLSRHELKKTRRPLYHSADQKLAHKSSKPYYSEGNIYDPVSESNQASIVRTLDKLNMAPANKKEGYKSQDPLIHKIQKSIAELIDDSTSPYEFNHVREDIIMQKITDIHGSRSALIEEDSITAPLQVSEEGIMDIEQLLSITHKARDTTHLSGTVKGLEKPTNTSIKGFFGKFKSIFGNFGSDEDIEDSEIVDHMHPVIDWSPLVPDPKKYAERSYSLGTIRRLRKLKVLYDQMKDPGNGIKYNTSGKVSGSKYVKNWFTGDQLITWLQRKFGQEFSGFTVEDTSKDLTTIARLLFHLGFIVSVERSPCFGRGEYIFQAPFFLPSELGTPSNWDYARYLLRRSYNSSSKYKLLQWEITNLDMLRNVLKNEWKSIEKQVDNDLTFLSKQGKIPCRIFKLQELRFWSVQRSAPDSCDHFLDEEAIFLKKQRLTGHDYEKKFSKNQAFLLSWNEKLVNQFQDWQHLRFTKVSIESASIIDHCNVTALIDPFFSDSSPSINPWVAEDESLWNPTRPISLNEIKYWKSGLNFVFMDKRGLDIFWEFCKKEFSDENLKFISSCRELDKAPTTQIFDRKAKYIYLEFIKQGASSEVNINSSIKNELHNIFLPLLKQKESLLPEQGDIFEKAYDHIFKLIEKDSYSRFCKTCLNIA